MVGRLPLLGPPLPAALLLLGLGAAGTPRETDEASHLRPHRVPPRTIDQQLTPHPKVLGQYDQVWSDGNYSGDAERHGRLDTGLLLAAESPGAGTLARCMLLHSSFASHRSSSPYVSQTPEA